MELTELPEKELPPWEYGRLGDFFAARAEKALGGKIIPNAPTIKFSDSISLYSRAADCFRIAGMWQDAGECLGRCADLQLSCGNKPKSQVYSTMAGDLAARVDPVDAVIYYRNAIAVCSEIKLFATAARLQFAIAELLEDDHNYEEAADAYRLAADYHSDDQDFESVDLCLDRAGYLLAYLKRFREASKLYVALAKRSVEHNLLRFNAHGYLLKAGLCLLADDDLMALTRQLPVFRKTDFSFVETRENLFLTNLLEIYRHNDLPTFADHCFNFDCVSKLEYIDLRILKKVRDNIKERGQLKDDYRRASEAIAEDRKEKQKFVRTMTTFAEADKFKLEYNRDKELE